MYKTSVYTLVNGNIKELAHRKQQKSQKVILHKPSYSPFCPKFRCHGNQGGSGVKLNGAIRLAIPEKQRTKNYDSILYTTKVMTV